MQDIALLDARRGVTMFEKISVPILGLVENMSSYLCPKCGHTEAIFGQDGAYRLAEQLKLPFLGKVRPFLHAPAVVSQLHSLHVRRCHWPSPSGKPQTKERPLSYRSQPAPWQRRTGTLPRLSRASCSKRGLAHPAYLSQESDATTTSVVQQAEAAALNKRQARLRHHSATLDRLLTTHRSSPG